MLQVDDSDMDLLFNLNFNVDDIEDLQDMTDKNSIKFCNDFTLELDDNNRISKGNVDILDTIEKDVEEQAF